jgi:hypothetical protein
MTACCSICGQPVKARGWCTVHYYKWYRTGDPLGRDRTDNTQGVCKVARCGKPQPVTADGTRNDFRGYCLKHFRAWQNSERIQEAVV